MKKYLIVLFAVIVCILVFALYPNKLDPEIEKLYERCEQIEIGMTYEQVLEIMGPPKERHYVFRDTITMDYWIYLQNPRMSTPVRCDFDSLTQRVIMVLCGEHSRKISNR